MLPLMSFVLGLLFSSCFVPFASFSIRFFFSLSLFSFAYKSFITFLSFGTSVFHDVYICLSLVAAYSVKAERGPSVSAVGVGQGRSSSIIVGDCYPLLHSLLTRFRVLLQRPLPYSILQDHIFSCFSS